MAETLCTLFARALDREHFGPDEDFFEYGGQSVSAMLLVSRIGEELGAEVALSELFEAPTPNRLAQRLGITAESPLERAEAGGAAAEPGGTRRDAGTPTAAAPPDALPLAPCQEFFCVMDKGSESGAFGVRHLMINSWRLTGPIDVAALQGALDDVVARHESLRTVVVREASPRYQVVEAAKPVRLTVRELPAPAGPERERLSDAVLADASTEDFDVRDLPLLRAVLGRFAADDAVLVLTMHHSAGDAWSAQVVMRDLAAFYAERTGHGPAALPEVRQYREHALAEAARRQRGEEPPDLGLWRERLRGAEAFSIPASPPARPEPGRGAYVMRNFEVGAATGAAVQRLAAETGSTPYMVMLSAFYLLAHGLGGGTDLTVTTFSSGRAEPTFRDTVGLFINMLPLRTDLAGAASFRDVVRRARETCVEAFSHEVLFGDIDRVAPDLFGPDGLTGRIAPTFEMVQSPLYGRTGTAGDLRYAESHHEAPPEGDCPDLADGMLWVVGLVGPGRYAGTVQYRRDEFSSAAVADMVARYLTILDTHVADPDAELSLEAG